MTDYAKTVEDAVETALGKLDLDDKARLLAGQDMWSLPAFPGIGLGSLVMSDGPVGVRGVRWTADDPSVALPSPTALAASWDPGLARRAGRLLAQEARRKGVHVLLAPTVNLHRSPLGGRHFEAYSEDPYLTGEIGTGYVLGVQDGGVGTTVKHFVANDAETDRFTVDNIVAPRPLRELYLAPFEAIVKNAHPWGIMAAYNQVNGSTMTEHRYLQNEVLRGEWGFDGYIVSDWMATRSTAAAVNGGLDVAMPGPRTVYGEALAAAVRSGEVAEAVVDGAVRNVLRLAARVGILDGTPPAVTELPAHTDGPALAREIARRSFVLVRNENGTLPLAPGADATIALIGAAAREARVLGGGSAQVFPAHVVSPLEGLTAALPAGATLTYATGADPTDELAAAGAGFTLRAVVRDAAGEILGSGPLPSGQIQWFGSDLPDGVTYEALHSVEVTGTFTPRESGPHTFGTKGLGGFKLAVDGRVLFDGVASATKDDPFEAFFGEPVPRGQVDLTAGRSVEVSLFHIATKPADAPIQSIGFSLAHRAPERDADEMIEEAVAAAAAAGTAIVVVATTDRVESEGFDRTSLALPGRQDELVARVAAVNPRTVVIVNSGSPVELPWREDVAAVLLGWFPGQEAGAALADVLLGAAEPGGRLPTTWPVALADVPVTQVVPDDGVLRYDEGVLIGYRAWERAGTVPAYPFGHGLGYTTWSYKTIELTGRTAKVRLRNTGSRPGREVVQLYVSPEAPETAGTPGTPEAPERPARWLAAFGSAEAGPGETVDVTLELPERAFQIWDETAGDWSTVPGVYHLAASHSLTDPRISISLRVGG
ncbi:beta-glucosidase H [Streptomyces paludis]|uniref:Glycosyl hydrolase n=1 Tax=Streptomyces paludis TaxID=2282738 RepID=A0A345HY99_9ACTN|nr:glycoside hydrolase family 3 C-terminal domain-containing protein [Streptomyces paludis]AXG81673.1 glycosyl hydrolase [Streptomyces paludis]